MRRMRIRELLPELFLGVWPPGELNSLTDVPGVLVNTLELHSDDGEVNTGVTSILPHAEWFNKACYAGLFAFNGAGEMTGSHWINETGLLQTPIVLTNTFAVGAAHEGILRYAVEERGGGDQHVNWALLPVVAETYDGYLNDPALFAVRPEHVVESLKNVSSGRVHEGCVGGGTGMLCHHFKGGTGSSSRLVMGFDAEGQPKTYTMAALVQANYGKKTPLRIASVPVGRILAGDAAWAAEADAAARARQEDLEREKNRKDGSIIVILATDAPLHPVQLQRVAKRATVGLARVGGQGHNHSGDIFLAFSTGNEIPVQVEPDLPGPGVYMPSLVQVDVVNDASIDGLLEAAADATEEAIYNALCMAETTTGRMGRTVEALPLKRVRDIVRMYL